MSFEPQQLDLVSTIQSTVARFGDRPFLGTEVSGEWCFQSYREIWDQVSHVRGGLHGLGVRSGDRVAIISGNRPEWVVAVYAIYSLGAVVVPMYEQQHQSEREYILDDSGASVCITSTAELAVSLANHGKLAHTVSMEPSSAVHSFAQLLKSEPVDVVVPTPGDLALISYTSGTTGNPKGVMLTHENLSSDVRSIGSLITITENDRSLAFLPWAHLFGSGIEMNSLVYFGASLAICPKVELLSSQLATARPTLLFAVPRVWNKLYTNVMQGIRQRPALLQRLFDSGLAAAKKRNAGKSLGLIDRGLFQLADRLIFSKIREKLGGRLRFAFTGSAALSPEVVEFIDGIGISTYEGYGMTETSGVATCNVPGDVRIGSVGKPIPGFRIELDHSVEGADQEQGEIIIFGPGVTPGYYNLEALTAEVKTHDGGMRSGDLGRFDKDGFLYITGRVKELFKMANGKYVAPAPLEESLTLSPFIAQAMITGVNRPFNVVVMAAEQAAIEQWCGAEGIDGQWPKLLEHARVETLIQEQLEHFGRDFRRFERAQAVVLLPSPLTTESGFLTPTLKIKRRLVELAVGDVIGEIYDGRRARYSLLPAIQGGEEGAPMRAPVSVARESEQPSVN